VPVQRCTLPLPITLHPLWAVRPVQSLSACTVELYLYSPYRPYGLYRASVPVQWCTLSLPIPALPLWAVRPVQSLNAFTRVHFTFTYTFIPPHGPYGLYRASVPVQGCTLHFLYIISLTALHFARNMQGVRERIIYVTHTSLKPHIITVMSHFFLFLFLS